MKKLKELAQKVLTKETILYVVFGVLTTVVNLATYFLLTHVFSLGENLEDVANAIAIVVAVLFAYFTNSLFVFNSKLNWSAFFKFILGRIFSAIVEMAGFALLLHVLNFPDLISKILINIIIIILNFFISKYFAFKKK